MWGAQQLLLGGERFAVKPLGFFQTPLVVDHQRRQIALRLRNLRMWAVVGRSKALQRCSRAVARVPVLRKQRQCITPSGGVGRGGVHQEERDVGPDFSPNRPELLGGRVQIPQPREEAKRGRCVAGAASQPGAVRHLLFEVEIGPRRHVERRREAAGGPEAQVVVIGRQRRIRAGQREGLGRRGGDCVGPVDPVEDRLDVVVPVGALAQDVEPQVDLGGGALDEGHAGTGHFLNGRLSNQRRSPFVLRRVGPLYLSVCSPAPAMRYRSACSGLPQAS